MDDVKGLLQSRTVWGALLAITATISQLFGWDLGDTNGLAEQVAALLAYNRKTEKTEAQIERDRLSKNPAGWFNQHFSNGLSKHSGKTDSTDKTKP